MILLFSIENYLDSTQEHERVAAVYTFRRADAVACKCGQN